jgi:hypothetical protein
MAGRGATAAGTGVASLEAAASGLGGLASAGGFVASSTSSSSEAYIRSSVARKLWLAAIAASAARRIQTIASLRSPRPHKVFAVETPQATSSTSSGLGSGSIAIGGLYHRLPPASF